MRKAKLLKAGFSGTLLLASIAVVGCNSTHDLAAEAPPAPQVQHEQDGVFEVTDPQQYPLTTAVRHDVVSQLAVTGVVNPDVTRTVPVVTLASGRVVEIKARVGDTVKKGQLLLRIRSDDISQGYDAYRKAVADELMARKQLERTQLLYEHGALAEQDLEAAQDAEEDAKTTLDTSTEHLRLLGNDPDHPVGIVEIVAPISGVITDQEVVNGSTIQSYSANPFTISDLSSVWLVCDVYENDISSLTIGQQADIRLNAYPGRLLRGRVSNIGAILDPTIRTAKVRIEVPNPSGIMRIGMFATAIFHSMRAETRAVVPGSAVLHLHDRQWVYVPGEGREFHRIEITPGDTLADDMQEVVAGIRPGQKVVAHALDLQNAIDNE